MSNKGGRVSPDYLADIAPEYACMRFENIRAVVARKTLKSLKESTWNTIKTILKDWGLKEDVNYKINNLEGTPRSRGFLHVSS